MDDQTTRRLRGIALPKLREIREREKLSREKLSTESGVDTAFIWRIENRGNGVGYANARALATALKVSVEDLMGESVSA